MSKNPEVPEISKVNDIPAPDAENIESSKLEWGQHLADSTKISLYEAEDRLDDYNDQFAGNKPWRLPTEGELKDAFAKNNSTPGGFVKDNYWSNTYEIVDGQKMYHVVSMSFGQIIGVYSKDKSFRVRLVR